MRGTLRHMYPGNNTPQGFYSYYSYILPQEQAHRIICIKGGPGVGKSTFMKKIGEELLDSGQDVDYLHCSSDNDSLDGILVKDLKVALIDATAPHVVDPINPGAVDTILHLGDYWNEEGIRNNKVALMECNKRISGYFSLAYNYLGAAGKMYESISSVYDLAVRKEEVYKIAASIVNKELTHKEIAVEPGSFKKAFISAITPNGLENYLTSLVSDYKKIYVLHAPVGISSSAILETFKESSIYRGYDAEGFFCPMQPDKKMEHLLVPKLGVALVTSNKFHRVETDDLNGEIIHIDLNNTFSTEPIGHFLNILRDSLEKMEALIEKSVSCIRTAKKEHDNLESFYIPNMDFDGIEELRLMILEKILTL